MQCFGVWLENKADNTLAFTYIKAPLKILIMLKIRNRSLKAYSWVVNLF